MLGGPVTSSLCVTMTLLGETEILGRVIEYSVIVWASLELGYVSHT